MCSSFSRSHPSFSLKPRSLLRLSNKGAGNMWRLSPSLKHLWWWWWDGMEGGNTSMRSNFRNSFN